MDPDYFIPDNSFTINLLKAEEIKCKLSSPQIKYENKYPIKLIIEEYKEKDFYLSKKYLRIIIENNLINHLNSLLKDLLNEARANFTQ